MNALQKIKASPLDLNRLRAAVREAATAVEQATQKCLRVGQMLNEAKDTVPHGEFEAWVQHHVPELPLQTANRWMRAAANIQKALPLPAVEVDAEVLSVSAILTLPDAELTPAARKYKQQWFDFTADKTIKNCLDGVCVEGDPGHRADRAINGKTKGGKGQADRKDFPLFVAVKLNDTGTHLGHYAKMSAVQKAEVQAVLRAAILGDETRLSRGAKGRLFKFKTWPEEVCEVMLETLKERLKRK